MALDTLINVSQDERERAINRSRRMWQTDYESNMNASREAGKIEGKKEGKIEGKKEGKIEGKKEGKKEGKIEMARDLLALGVPAETIQKASGLTNEEIRKLRSSN